MRTHRAFPGLQPWSDPALLRELVVPNRLTVLRVEPVARAREPAAIVDLHFSAGDRHVTLPLILIDVAMLILREADPLVFPQAIAGLLDDEALAPLVDVVAAALEPRAYGTAQWVEDTIVFRADPLFDRARARGWFGAAPLAVSVPRIAPALYARRFAPGRTLLAYGPYAHEAAAFVRDLARRCDVALTDDDAARYFGAAGSPDAGPYDLAIGSGPEPAAAAGATSVRIDENGAGAIPVVAPLPTDVLVSFDPADGPVVGSFTIERPREPLLREPGFGNVPPRGGSSGRIALMLRPDAAELPDADVDEARALGAALAAEGFTVTLATRLADVAAFGADLIHLFGVRDGSHAATVAAWAAEAGIPLAVHAYHEDPSAGGYWGALVTRYCFAYSADDRSVTDYLDVLAKRAVEVDGVIAAQRYAPPAASLAAAESVLRDAAVVFVQSERERATLATIRPVGEIVVVPALPAGYDAPEAIGPLVGGEAYVLVHGPLEPAGNQLLVARAASSLGLPIVLAGPVADPAYAELVREFAADGVRVIPEPSLGQAAALYRSAAIVADVAWMGRGHARIVEAARAGSATVLADARWAELPLPAAWRVDPADVNSVARGIGEAWDAVARRDPALGQVQAAAARAAAGAVRTIVSGYAKIAVAD